MKTIYIITHSFPPINIVGALRPFRLAKYISKHGWKPIIVTHSATKMSALDFSLLQELSPGTQIHYLFSSKPLIISDRIRMNDIMGNNGLKLIRKNRLKNELMVRALGTGRGLLNRALMPDIDIIWAPFFLKTVFNMLNDTKSKLILTTSPPHSIHLVGLLLSRIKGIPWIADFRDPWDNYPATGRIELRNPLERYMERAVVARADAIISTTMTYTTNLLNKHKNVPEDKFFTITNSFDEEKFSIPNNKPNSDKFVISYTGIFYPEKDPFTFFRALRSWFEAMSFDKRREYQSILQVQLIGTQKSIVDKIIKDYGLEKIIHFIERVPHQEAIKLTRGSDLLLISTGIGGRTRPGWLPAKLFEYLGCRKPILAIIPEGEIANTIRETNSGYVVTSENHSRIHEILETEIQNKFSDSRQPTSRHFTFTGVEKFEETRVISEMINIIERVRERSENILG